MYEKQFHGFSRTIMLCGDIRTEMVKHEISLLTSALNHMSHADNTGEDQSVHSSQWIAKWIYTVSQNRSWFDKVIAKIKWCSFFDSHVISHTCFSMKRCLHYGTCTPYTCTV